MAMLTRVVTMLALALFLPANAFAQTKVALIITNQSYAANPGVLENPHRDGERIERALDQPRDHALTLRAGRRHAVGCDFDPHLVHGRLDLPTVVLRGVK